MAELLSVGLDVGTTTSQMILSRLTVENRESSFSVPKMQITDRQILYRSAIAFTPLLDKERVDTKALGIWLAAQYGAAGITPEQVDTGAVIITGESSRKENAKAVLEHLSSFAGEFVVTTAGPHLESVLAAKGAGATEYSEETGKTVLHMDIGGGTANLAWIENGRITKTGCLNVGGRLIKLDAEGRITYISPVLEGLADVRLGEMFRPEAVIKLLVSALEMAAGLREITPLLEKLWTKECGEMWQEFATADAISFSGGVADCIEKEYSSLAFGDIGPALGKAVRDSLLCKGAYRLGQETIRATVIGAGCHSTQLSGSTVFYQNITFPLKNLPVVTDWEQNRQQDADMVVLALPGISAPGYQQVVEFAERIAKTVAGAVLVALENDMAKALGHALSLRLPKDTPILCIDRVQLTEDCYLDVGGPVGPCVPLVVKTLVLMDN